MTWYTTPVHRSPRFTARLVAKPATSAPKVTCSRGPFVALDAGAASADSATKPVWVQVAKSGTFDGYAGGDAPFTFDRSTFNDIVRNFRSHPSYQPGPDGVGAADVVPWDFAHATEAGPDGAIAMVGAPAQGWARELDVRPSDDGGAELWALTRWLEPARTYILDGAYRWASVAVDFAGVDPVSGERNGPTLLSIALTNKPFIQGMRELVAASRGGFPSGAGPSVAFDSGDDPVAVRDCDGVELDLEPSRPLAERVRVVAAMFPVASETQLELQERAGHVNAALLALKRKGASGGRAPMLASAYPGGNMVQKTLAMLRASKLHGGRPLEELVPMAGELVRTGQVI
jgi:hypothetical protein